MEAEQEPLLSGSHSSAYGSGNEALRSQQLSTQSTDSILHRPLRGHLQGSTSNEEADDFQEIGTEPESILQALVFIEDGIHYRSIHHRVDKTSLKLYRVYYSKPMQWSVYFVIAVIHLLGFVEIPSSLTHSSDLRLGNIRPLPPCGVTESIELICLLLLLSDAIVKAYLRGRAQTLKSSWLLGYIVFIIFSLVEWSVAISMFCHETIRIRRILRPYFLLQNSSLMKKTVKSLKRTMPQVISVLVLLFMHLYFFTLFGMLLFPKEHKPKNETVETLFIAKTPTEHKAFFSSLDKGFMNLLVLLTTANNPDVTMPAYNVNRFYSIYFIIFLGIGLYCLLNMLTAVIYNQFRGCFTDSMQASFFRRHLALRAAFEVLKMRHVATGFRSTFQGSGQYLILSDLKSVFMKIKIRRVVREAILKELDDHPSRNLTYSEYQRILRLLDMNIAKMPKPPLIEVDNRILHRIQRIFSNRNFNFFGCFVAGINVIIITLELAIEYDHVASTRDNYLGVFNLVFIIYYGFEQGLKCWALGWQRFCWDRGNIFDAAITVVLIVIELVYLVRFGVPYTASNHRPIGVELWDLVRITNMLILVRLARMVVTQIKSMFIVASTLLDLIKNLRAFAGLMVVLYYSYALLGMELFRGAITYEDVKNMTNKTDYTKMCGTFEQLDYWSNNFDDLMSSLVVLWDVMIVNNWHVFLDAYSRYTSKWSQIYFIVWWLISVVFSANLFTALILENFIMRWDKRNHGRVPVTEDLQGPLDMDSFQTNYITVHQMFREGLQEPSEESILVELRQHPHFISC